MFFAADTAVRNCGEGAAAIRAEATVVVFQLSKREVGLRGRDLLMREQLVHQQKILQAATSSARMIST